MPISDSTTFAICYGAWGSPNACEGAIICLDGKASQGESICNATMATRNPIRWRRSVALSWSTNWLRRSEVQVRDHSVLEPSGPCIRGWSALASRLHGSWRYAGGRPPARQSSDGSLDWYSERVGRSNSRTQRWASYAGVTGLRLSRPRKRCGTMAPQRGPMQHLTCQFVARGQVGFCRQNNPSIGRRFLPRTVKH